MSNAIVHRPHVSNDHAALLTLTLVVCAVLVATLVLWAVNQPEQGVIITTGGEVTPAASVAPAAVSPPDSPVFRHALMRTHQAGGLDRSYVNGRMHQVDGATLDPIDTAPAVVQVPLDRLPTASPVPFGEPLP